MFWVRFNRHINDVYFSKIPKLIGIVVPPGFGNPLYPRLAPFSERQRVYEAR
jgi:hypothetical protein